MEVNCDPLGATNSYHCTTFDIMIMTLIMVISTIMIMIIIIISTIRCNASACSPCPPCLGTFLAGE